MYFIIGIDIDDDINELGMLEFIHNMVETLDKYFENVCELDVSLSSQGRIPPCLIYPLLHSNQTNTAFSASDNV